MIDEDNLKILGFIILVIVLVTIGPLLVIWSINTLFPIADIPYTFKTWIAALLIGGSLNLKS